MWRAFRPTAPHSPRQVESLSPHRAGSLLPPGRHPRTVSVLGSALAPRKAHALTCGTPQSPCADQGQVHNIFRCEIRFCMVTKHVCIRRGLIRCTALLFWQAPSTTRDPGCLLCLAGHFSVTSGEMWFGSLCLEETCDYKALPCWTGGCACLSWGRAAVWVLAARLAGGPFSGRPSPGP